MGIEVLSKSKSGKFAALKLKKHREAEKLFIAEGAKCVSELCGTFPPIALIASQKWIGANSRAQWITSFDAVYQANSDNLRRLSSMSTPADVIGVFAFPDQKQPSRLTDDLYIALDGIQDPGNLGTIIRTADWFGVRTVFASPGTVDVFNAKTIQATMGSLARVEVYYTDLIKLFEDNPHVPVYGTLLDGTDIYTTPLSKSGIIVMGNEGNGLSVAVREHVTHRLLLPPYPPGDDHAESLNVGIATALVTAEFRRRQSL